MTIPTAKILRFLGGFALGFFGGALSISPALDGPIIHWLKAALIGVVAGALCTFMGERAWKWIVQFVDL